MLWRNYGRDLEKTEKFTELYQRIITKRASVGAKKYLNCNYSWVVVIGRSYMYYDVFKVCEKMGDGRNLMVPS